MLDLVSRVTEPRRVIVFPSESEILCEIASMNARARALSRTMMMSRQETLARLPLPSLEDTLARYLRAATPVVASPAQLQATRALVDEAVQERGLKLSRCPYRMEVATLV